MLYDPRPAETAEEAVNIFVGSIIFNWGSLGHAMIRNISFLFNKPTIK